MTARLALAALALMLSTSACAGKTSRYSRKAAQASMAKLETPGVVLGEFRLTKVVDGDTVRVDGLDAAMRLIALDAEETFKSENDRRLYEAGWTQYLETKRGESKRPTKAATPMGEAAKHWAVEFFKGVTTVRLERDSATEIRDRYNRYLAYVMVPKNGTWVNFNVEVVRAGMSPYFMKYGYSKRFHADFVAAEREAQTAQRGIWAAGAEAYPDYAERFSWWDARARFIAAFDTAAAGKPNYFAVTQWDLIAKLEQAIGKEVTLLGTVGDVRIGDRGPIRVTLSRRLHSDFPLVFFDRDVFGTSGIAQWRGEFVTVTGVVTEYTNKYNGRKQLQIQIDRPSQIQLSQIPGLTPPVSTVKAP